MIIVPLVVEISANYPADRQYLTIFAPINAVKQGAGLVNSLVRVYRLLKLVVHIDLNGRSDARVPYVLGHLRQRYA